ncbi:hypothetical protein WJX77_005702 [Trebouxia sp. C0004]
MCRTPPAFRSLMRDITGESLSQFQPEDEPTEMASQIALRHSVCALRRTLFDGKECSHIDHINLNFDAFVDEHEYIYGSILIPVKEYMQQQLPESVPHIRWHCLDSAPKLAAILED